jgi:excisionase family DNA binding protein
MRLIRPDYHKKAILTYAEVAEMGGVTVGTVCKWVSAGKLPLERTVGAFRIDNMTAQKFLRKGLK